MFNRKKVRDLKEEVRDLKYRLERREELVNANNKLTIENSELTSSLHKAKTQIRKQTEADIYFASAKIMKELENGATKDQLQEQINHRDALYAQLAEQRRQMEASRQSSPYSPLAGILGGLGRGFPY